MGGSPRWPEVGECFLDVLRRDAERVRSQLGRFPQTNEVARSAAMLGGFLCIAERTGLPLRLLEIGTSAGLNLRFDRYRYELGAQRWGDPGSPVRVVTDWEGPALAGPAALGVASRSGWDLAPIDVGDPQEAARLCSYVWADHPDRLARTQAAIELTRTIPARIERASAAEWLPSQLARLVPGRASVVHHSTVWAYLSEAERESVRGAILSAGRRASPQAPLAWLRLEEGEYVPQLQLSLWPAGTEEILGEAHPHGSWVRWFGPKSRGDGASPAGPC